MKYLIPSVAIFLLIYASLGLNQKRREKIATKKDYLLYVFSLIFFILVVFSREIMQLVVFAG